MKAVFIGTVEFSYQLLNVVIGIPEVEIVGIVTKQESSFNADFRDLAEVGKTHSIPYLYVSDVNAPKTLQWIRKLEPDVIFCFGWSSLIKKELLELAPKGVIGYHPAALPQNRGRHPIIWALALGLHETASTFFRMDEGADSGDIICQDFIKINEKQKRYR